MKLASLLNVIDDCENVLVLDDNAPISVPPLFNGLVKDCKTSRDIHNGVVKMIIRETDHLALFIDIEYQKNRRRSRNEKNSS